MRIFLTGASGFIGSFLAESLVNKNEHVKCLLRRTSSLQWLADLDIECVYGELNDKESLKRGIQNAEIVIHIAGVTKGQSEQDFLRGNYQYTKNLVDVLLNNTNKVRHFIYMSSQAATGPGKNLNPVDENTTPAPVTYYGKSKLLAEKTVEELKDKIPVTIIRAPTVFGPRDENVLTFFKIVKNGIIPKVGKEDKYLSIIYVKDLVEAVQKIITNKKTFNQTYFLSDPQPYSWDDIAQVILDNLGRKAIKIPVPLVFAKGIAVVNETVSRLLKKTPLINRQRIYDLQQDFWICSPQKAQNDFGFKTRYTLDDAIGETLAWYIRSGWL